MDETLGQLIKKVAEGQGLTQQQVGDRINQTKQGAASIYKRSTIDTELLKELCKALDYDFFASLYNTEPLLKFKEAENAIWESRITRLEEEIESKNKLLETKEELLILQRKYIHEIEEKVKKTNE